VCRNGRVCRPARDCSFCREAEFTPAARVPATLAYAKMTLTLATVPSPAMSGLHVCQCRRHCVSSICHTAPCHRAGNDLRWSWPGHPCTHQQLHCFPPVRQRSSATQGSCGVISAAKADPAHPGSLTVSEDFVCQTPSLTWAKVAAHAATPAPDLQPLSCTVCDTSLATACTCIHCQQCMGPSTQVDKPPDKPLKRLACKRRMLRKPACAPPRPGAAQTPATYTPARTAPATLTAAGCRMAVNTTDFWTRTLFSAGPPVEYASMDARPAYPPLSRTRPLDTTQL